MVLWEVWPPRRRREIPRVIRWTNNLALVVVDTVILRLSFPILAIGLAVMAEERGWGLFNNLDAPFWVAVAVSMLLLDLAIYLQHVMFHAVPGLWRLHRMHHADLDFDATTGLRFHPVEILISMAIKLAVVAALGPPAVAVLLFEVILNGTALFNHANIDLPRPIDRWLRWIVVTPDMHRVHHSVDRRETNANYGFNLPWWDRLLGTYVAQPAKGHEGMEIGIEQFRTRRDLWLKRTCRMTANAFTRGIRENRVQVVHQLIQVMLVGFAIGMTRTVVPALAESEFGLERGSFLLLASFVVAFGAVKAVMNFVAGRWSERIGRKRVLAFGWVAALPIPVMIWYAPDWNWIVAATVLLGVNQGLCWSMTQTAKLDLTRAEERGLTMGLNEFSG
ncbi:MAG: MFS transporter [Rhodobacteraceae bacterium]|nr:MFS transporter [Paracoccaceae bacterium]